MFILRGQPRGLTGSEVFQMPGKMNGGTVLASVMGGVILGLMLFIVFAFFKAFFFIVLVLALLLGVGYVVYKRKRNA